MKTRTFRFGCEETLETRTLAILPVGFAGVNGVLRVHVVLRLPVDICSGRNWSASCGDKRTVAAFACTLDEFWVTGTQDPG